MEQDSENSQGESQQQFKELKKREEEIDSFTESFEETKQQEQQKLHQIQENIVSLLESCNQKMEHMERIDSATANELKNMQDTLVTKETDINQSESTTKSLSTEARRLRLDLEKVQQLEGKISSELEAQRQQLSSMETDLRTYKDLDTLKKTAEDKKKKLEELRASLSQRQESFRLLLNDISQKRDALKAKLDENETHAQLTNLERKWQHLEQNNFVMKEFIASKSQESDYAPVSQRVTQQVAEYNQLLIEALKNNRTLI